MAQAPQSSQCRIPGPVYLSTLNTVTRAMPHTSGPDAVPVCVIRMNFAVTGVNAIVVVGVWPAPCATGVPQVLPSSETWTL